jgi:hypothetical protein
MLGRNFSWFIQQTNTRKGTDAVCSFIFHSWPHNWKLKRFSMRTTGINQSWHYSCFRPSYPTPPLLPISLSSYHSNQQFKYFFEFFYILNSRVCHVRFWILCPSPIGRIVRCSQQKGYLCVCIWAGFGFAWFRTADSKGEGHSNGRPFKLELWAWQQPNLINITLVH